MRQITDTGNNMAGSQMHYAEWEKPDPKDILNDSICMASGKGKSKEMEWLPAVKSEERAWLQKHTYREFFSQLLCILDVVVVTCFYAFVRTHKTIIIKWVLL